MAEYMTAMKSRIFVQLLDALTVAALQARKRYKLEAISACITACDKITKVYKRLLPYCMCLRDPREAPASGSAALNSTDTTYVEILGYRLYCLVHPDKKSPMIRICPQSHEPCGPRVSFFPGELEGMSQTIASLLPKDLRNRPTDRNICWNC